MAYGKQSIMSFLFAALISAVSFPAPALAGGPESDMPVVLPQEPVTVTSNAGDMGNLQEEFLFFSEGDMSSIGSLRLKPISASPGAISVITAKTISAMAARHLADILKIVPGFDVRYNNFGEYSVSVNGVDNPSNILVMIDGHRFNNFYTGGALYDIPVDGIDRIEIIRGPGSAIYGTNAMVAVINIISKHEDGAKVSVGGGTFDTYKANVTLGMQGEEISVHAFMEVYNTAGGDGMVVWDRLSNNDATRPYSSAPARMEDDKHKLFGHVDANYKETLINLNMYTETRGPNFAYRDVISDRSSVDSGYISLDATRTFDFSGKASVTPRLYADRWAVDNRIQLYPNGYKDNRDLNGDGQVEYFPNGEWLNKSYELWTYGAELKLEKEWQDGNVVTLGVSNEQSEMNNVKVTTNYSGEPESGAVVKSSFANWNNYAFPARSRTVYAAYLQDDWTPNRYFNAVLGARHDKYSDFGDTTNPRVAVSIFPVEKLALKLQYATAFHAPTFRELYDKTDMQFSGNPNLKPEAIEAYEVGIGYTYETNSYVRLSGFRNTIKDYITALFNTTQSQATDYQNAGTLEISGYAIEAKHSYEENSYFYWNASMFNVKDISSDSWLTRVPQVRANAGLAQSLPYKSQVSLDWMYSDTAMANARTSDERLAYNRAISGPYNLVNLAFSKRGIFRKYSLKVSAFNLLGIDYKELYSDTRYRFPNPVVGGHENHNLLPSNQRMYMIEIAREF